MKAAFELITVGKYMRMIADWGRETGLKYFIYLLILVLSGAMSGCAVQPGLDLGDRDPDFVALGKLSVRSGNDQHTANFSWRQFDRTYAVEVWGPLGQGRTQFVGDKNNLTVSKGDKVLAQGDPEAVMLENLGWSIPVSFLPQWLLGTDVNETSPTQEVGGWAVEFSRFQGLGEARRPQRIEAQREAQRIVVFVREIEQ